jgi:hypothetical protein
MANEKGSGRLIWALGVSLFTHVVAFFDVFYFDQMILFWYLLLAMVSSATNLSVKARLAPALDKMTP